MNSGERNLALSGTEIRAKAISDYYTADDVVYSTARPIRQAESWLFSSQPPLLAP